MIDPRTNANQRKLVRLGIAYAAGRTVLVKRLKKAGIPGKRAARLVKEERRALREMSTRQGQVRQGLVYSGRLKENLSQMGAAAVGTAIHERMEAASERLMEQFGDTYERLAE